MFVFFYSFYLSLFSQAILCEAYFGVYTLFLIAFVFLFFFYTVGFKIWTTVDWIFLINKKPPVIVLVWIHLIISEQTMAL